MAFFVGFIKEKAVSLVLELENEANTHLAQNPQQNLARIPSAVIDSWHGYERVIFYVITKFVKLVVFT